MKRLILVLLLLIVALLASCTGKPRLHQVEVEYGVVDREYADWTGHDSSDDRYSCKAIFRFDRK